MGYCLESLVEGTVDFRWSINATIQGTHFHCPLSDKAKTKIYIATPKGGYVYFGFAYTTAA